MKGKQCGNCSKQGHFVVVYRSEDSNANRRNNGGRSYSQHKPKLSLLQHAESLSTSDDKYMYAVSSDSPRTPKAWITRPQV